jgi:hypothetical protein
MVRADAAAEASAERFTGGQLRAMVSRRSGIELSLDLRTQSNEAQTERVRDFPVQASLLLFPIRSSFSPYVLGGIGWYSHRVEQLSSQQVVESETTRRVGSHAGFGAELRLGKHAGIHADYRYTFLKFGSKDDDPNPSSALTAGGGSRIAGNAIPGSQFLPGYEGSMWTGGFTIYF